MKSFLLSVAAVFVYQLAFSQSTFRAIVKDEHTQQALVGVNVSVQNTSLGGSTNPNGEIVIENIPEGAQTLVFSYIGYETLEQTFTFPISETIEIELEPSEEELEEIVVTTTRSSRTIEDVPTRIEAIAGEELEEKLNMDANNVAMLIRENTGIQTQQTSAVSASTNIRIQGLDGRYTQILQNGLPSYAGFSSGLSILQIPPLDLQRVEIVKGSSSTLYGGGAIAGLINFIQKEPTEEGELTFLVNGTSAGGLDLNGYYAKQFGKFGMLFYSSAHYQEPYDPNKDDFTDIPKLRRYNVNPRFNYNFSENTRIVLGVNLTTEDREGGFIPKIDGDDNPFSQYVETNLSDRVVTQLQFEHQFSEQARLFIRNSFNYFDREIKLSNYNFAGTQRASFSEVGYARQSEKMEWIAGLNLWTDDFKERNVAATQAVRDYQLNTFGAFVQNNWNASEHFIVETGLRTDYQDEYGWFVLPRISALFKITDRLTSRLGGGLGYKSPTIFTEETEEVAFRNVLPIDINDSEAETSVGANWDVNYRAIFFDKISFSINHLFFYTRLDNALVLNPIALTKGTYEYINADGYVDSRGFETNIKFSYEPFKLFFNYTFVDTERNYQNLNDEIPLTARNRLGLVFAYEVHGKWLAGYEAYYTGTQALADGTRAREYWTMGLMAERIFRGKNLTWSIFLNAENFTDVRISRWQPMFTGSVQNPRFETEIYAPTDGRIVNGGVKIRL